MEDNYKTPPKKRILDNTIYYAPKKPKIKINHDNIKPIKLDFESINNNK